jgi:TPR repeat protein
MINPKGISSRKLLYEGWELFLIAKTKHEMQAAGRLLKIAADSQNPEALFFYGKFLDENGEYRAAYKVFYASARLGYSGAWYRLGLCFELGRGVSQSGVRALAAYRQAARQRNRYGMVGYSNLLSKLNPDSITLKLKKILVRLWAAISSVPIILYNQYDVRIQH